jgi:two-component system, LuxR family, response regulator FixJ
MHESKTRADYLSLLTGREKEILICIIQGYDKKQIAKSLAVSLNTVNTHFKNIFSKLEVHSLPELMLKILKEPELQNPVERGKL